MDSVGLPLVIGVSGSGTLLEAMIKENLPIGVVIADRDCRGLRIAEKAQIPAVCIGRTFGPSFDRDAFSMQVAQELVFYEARIFASAGFGTELSRPFFEIFDGEAWNSHPALLPRHKGSRAVEETLLSDDFETGTTIHRLELALDDGEIVLQERIPIYVSDRDPAIPLKERTDRLWERIKVLERKIYPEFLWSRVRALELV